MHGICWAEFLVKDAAASAKFLSDLFGWQTKQWGDRNYYFWKNESDKLSGGLDPNMPPNTQTLVYVEVEDVKATVEKTRALGGGVIAKYCPLGDNMGVYAIITTPEGTTIGIWGKQ